MPLIFKHSPSTTQIQAVDASLSKSKQKRVGLKRSDLGKKNEANKDKNALQRDIQNVTMNRKPAIAVSSRTHSNPKKCKSSSQRITAYQSKGGKISHEVAYHTTSSRHPFNKTHEQSKEDKTNEIKKSAVNLKRSQSTQKSNSLSQRKTAEQSKVAKKKQGAVTSTGNSNHSRVKIKQDETNKMKKADLQPDFRKVVEEVDMKLTSPDDEVDLASNSAESVSRKAHHDESRDEVDKYANDFDEGNYRSHFRFDEYGSVSEEEPSGAMTQIRGNPFDEQVSDNAFSSKVASAGAMALGATLLVGEGVHNVVQTAINSMNYCTLNDTRASYVDPSPRQIGHDNKNVLQMIRALDDKSSCTNHTPDSSSTYLTNNRENKYSPFVSRNMGCTQGNADRYLSRIDEFSAQNCNMDTYVDSHSTKSTSCQGSHVDLYSI